jgi:hypothetical protein
MNKFSVFCVFTPVDGSCCTFVIVSFTTVDGSCCEFVIVSFTTVDGSCCDFFLFTSNIVSLLDGFDVFPGSNEIFCFSTFVVFPTLEFCVFPFTVEFC